MSENAHSRIQRAAKGAHQAKNKLCEVAHCIEIVEIRYEKEELDGSEQGELRKARSDAEEVTKQLAGILRELDLAQVAIEGERISG